MAATPADDPWVHRKHQEHRAPTTRTPYEIDRDRIIHCVAFRELQYKTQVQSLLASQQGRSRTRLNHVIEVAQLARGIARAVGATEALAEAIALAHDLGHPPFGHAGERALRDALESVGRHGWNANVHSLDVVDFVECSFIAFRGLNLTRGTREGIARHSTPFDEPVASGELAQTRWGGLECQIVDAADVLAYVSHDLDDALAGGYLELSQIAEASPILEEHIARANEEWSQSKAWPSEERNSLIRRSVIARLIGYSLRDIIATSKSRIAELPEKTSDGVRNSEWRVVEQTADYASTTKSLLRLLTDYYYRSPSVKESDQQAVELVKNLFQALLTQPHIIPARFSRVDATLTAATYLASLNDHGAIAVAKELGVDQAAALN